MIQTQVPTTFARWLPILALAGIAVLGMTGCGGDNSVTDSSVVGMRVDFTASPDPIIAEPSADTDFEWTATYTITPTETGGLGGTITGVGLTLRAASGGIEVITDEDPSETTLEAGDARLEANGTRDLTFVTRYSVPGDGSEAFLDFAVEITDDEGFRFQDGRTFPIP